MSVGGKERSRRCRCAWVEKFTLCPGRASGRQPKSRAVRAKTCRCGAASGLLGPAYLSAKPYSFQVEAAVRLSAALFHTLARPPTPEAHPQRVSYSPSPSHSSRDCITHPDRLLHLSLTLHGGRDNLTFGARPNPSTERSCLSRPELTRAACAQPLSVLRNEWECHARPTTRYRGR